MFLTTLALLTSTPVHAADYKADVAHSILEFEVEALLGPVHGTFKDWKADVSIEGNDLSTLSGSVTVDVATIDTRIAKRDKHLRNEDFFHVEVHPNATFTTTNVVVPAEEGKLIVNGDLSIHGHTVPLSVPFVVAHHDEKRLRLTGDATISRAAFGIDYQSRMNPIQDDVKLNFNLNLVPVQD